MKKTAVVIIDDVDDFRKSLSGLLTRNGILVLGSFTRNEFLKRTMLVDETDIVVLTFETPKFLNELTIACLRKSFPLVKILINSVFEDKDTIDKIKSMNIDGLIFNESEDPGQIIKAIYALKENRKYFGEIP